MDLTAFKALIVLIFLADAMGMGLIPVYSKAFSESPTVLGIANAFSGGIFLAMSVMHIMPDQVENYAELKGESTFPLPFLLIVIGYTFMLIIDKVLYNTHVIFEKNNGQEIDAAQLINSVAEN